ncbi:MAG: hypothetical protein ABL894_02790, partial [Hyphomicrobium sp.]
GCVIMRQQYDTGLVYSNLAQRKSTSSLQMWPPDTPNLSQRPGFRQKRQNIQVHVELAAP